MLLPRLPWQRKPCDYPRGMNRGSHLVAGLRPLVDLVYPPRCPVCGDATAQQGGLCSACWGDLEFPGTPCCAVCLAPMAPQSHAERAQCHSCCGTPPAHAGVFAATIYNDASRRLVLNLKHGHKIALAGLMGRLMAARLPAPDPQVPPPLLVPVPLHRWRLWRRGYNQAALLAAELGRLGKGSLAVDALIRRKRTPSLGGLGRLMREQALAGAIEVRESSIPYLEGRNVILVDDVLTSGATSDACVATLLGAGARSVRIACFARVVDGRGMGNVRRKTETPEAITAPGAT